LSYMATMVTMALGRAHLHGIPKSPNYYSPLNNLQAAQERKATVLDQMVKYGYLDSATAEKTKNEKLALVKPDPAKDDKGEASYFVDYVTQKLIDKYGADAVYKDGLQVYTTIDMDMQRAAEKAMKGLPNGKKDANGVQQPQGALVAIDPHTGYVKAMVGGRGTDQFNRATMAERQPGSAFKPFVFAAALENKFSPSTVINDSPIKIGDWEPQNDEHTFSGAVTMRQVAQHSMNVPTVKIAQKLGIEKVLYYAQEMGISTLVMDGPHNDKNLASALGGLTKGVTPLELTSAYGTFANKGVHVDPVVIVKVLDRNGKVIDEANPEQHNVISESSAADLTSMLQDVIRAGTGRRANIGRPAAGKTGTTSDYHDAWFVGYTPDLVASVWIGNDDNTSLGGIYGGTVPATIWKNFMTEALKGTPAKDFDGSESSGGDSIGSLEDDKSTAVTKKSAAPAKKEEKPAEKKSKDEGKKQPGQQPAAPQGQAPASAPASAGGGGGAAPEPGSSVSKGRN
ncbi:transglycosylase domain-containing protein, partial [Mitsuokella jalaludinii]|uniref:transglycosylase domain-containing protein n=1 Tax=Mitsuokella jalaludinii TaxID=187979 RepID=UPI00307ADE82